MDQFVLDSRSMKIRLYTLAILLIILLLTTHFSNISYQKKATKRVLSEREISLDKRYDDKFVNGVMKYNILLNLAYIRGIVTNPSNIKENEVKKDFHYELKLKPQEIFTYHDSILPQYKNKLLRTTPVQFGSDQGFKSDGYLVGDGVCHLASLIYWAAKDANLDVQAPTNHDFRAIPEIPKKYGVSIYYQSGGVYQSAMQNLYVTNNRKNLISINFHYEKDMLKISISEVIN